MYRIRGRRAHSQFVGKILQPRVRYKYLPRNIKAVRSRARTKLI